MGKMKFNRKFIKNREAVSAVIGVILMVAITVAIVGVLWGYLSGLIGGPTTDYTMSAQLYNTDTTNHAVTYTVEKVSDAAIKWEDITVSLIEDDGTVSSGSIADGTLSRQPSDATYVAIGQTFTVDVGDSAWTGIIKLIYKNDVLWTSQTLSL